MLLRRFYVQENGKGNSYSQPLIFRKFTDNQKPQNHIQEIVSSIPRFHQRREDGNTRRLEDFGSSFEHIYLSERESQ